LGGLVSILMAAIVALSGVGSSPRTRGSNFPHQPAEASDPNSLDPKVVPARVASDYVLVNDMQGMWTIRKIDPATGLVDPNSPAVYINSENVGDRPRDPWGEVGRREDAFGEPVPDMQTVWCGPDGVTRKVSWWGPPTQYE
jgi:hypothetical protein